MTSKWAVRLKRPSWFPQSADVFWYVVEARDFEEATRLALKANPACAVISACVYAAAHHKLGPA